MQPMISRSPNDPSADLSGKPSRLNSGPPPSPNIRTAPRKPDPADENTLNMLGSSPMGAEGGLSDASTGIPGMALGSVAGIAKGIQGLATVFPGLVPPEVMMWLENIMQQVPQMLQQQQSLIQSPPQVAGATPQMMGPSTQQPPMAPPPPMGGNAGMSGMM